MVTKQLLYFSKSFIMQYQGWMKAQKERNTINTIALWVYKVEQ